MTQVIILKDKAALAAEAAKRFVDLSQEAVGRYGRFIVALSGGSTPKAMHQLLARPPLCDSVPWANVFVFWGDERFVPPNDVESSFLMAQETLLAQVPIPPGNIHPVPTVGLSPQAAAQQYTAQISAVLGDTAVPRFDLILLGMGPDGHIASLFPGHAEVISPGNTFIAVVTESPKPPPLRLTFTYKLINQAANVIFLVAGTDKAEMIGQLLGDTAVAPPLPAKLVQPVNGNLIWLVDEAAAEHIS